MARLGIMTTEFPDRTIGDAARALRSHGVATAQLQLGSVVDQVTITDSLQRGLDVTGPYLSDALAKIINGTCTELGVTIAAVDGTYNMIHPDRDRRFRNLDHLLRLIQLARPMGTGLVTLCTGTRADTMWQRDPLNSSPEAWNDLVEQLRPATRAAESAGVTLAFEPEHANVVDSAKRAVRLIDAVGSPALKVLFDPANVFHRGDLQRQRDHLAEAFDLVSEHIALVHAKDLDHDGAAGGRAAGQGLLDYPFILSELDRRGYDGAIILHQLKELDGPGIDHALQFLRDLAPRGYLS
ncbi:epimerase [Microlunatus endophyticus]|uniref:Epimerase n=1 Tax=Microlunatus endophyticus TaxID=1716077 RepID=A0A917SDR2_9ACTN|nr:sugar phosphate isomerase/epimerase family protein [Microlunatus endophyticus]GGL73103.1 epimerase [Microlunatus endophyticus]